MAKISIYSAILTESPKNRKDSLTQRKTDKQLKISKDFVVRRSFIILLLPYYHQFYCKTFSLILVCEYDCKNELYKVKVGNHVRIHLSAHINIAAINRKAH